VYDLDRNMSRLQLPIRGRQGSPLRTNQGFDNQPTESSLSLRPRNPIGVRRLPTIAGQSRGKIIFQPLLDQLPEATDLEPLYLDESMPYFLSHNTIFGERFERMENSFARLEERVTELEDKMKKMGEGFSEKEMSGNERNPKRRKKEKFSTMMEKHFRQYRSRSKPRA